MSLITIDQAKHHLRLTFEVGSPPDELEADVREKMAAAEDIILRYVNVNVPDGSPAGWDEGTVPAAVRAAILLQLSELYRFRGDDAAGPQRATGDLAPAIANLLRISGFHDPGLA